MGLILVLWFWLSGCRTVHLAEDIQFYGLQAKPNSPGEQVGVVNGYDCALRVLGFGPSAKLTKAFEMLQKEQNLQYVTRMKVSRRFRTWLMVDRDCWIVRGIGYK